MIGTLCARRAGPLRPDAHAIERRNPHTVQQYRRHLRIFLQWCAEHGLELTDTAALDDLLVEFKNMCDVSKAQFAYTLSAVQMAYPAARGNLQWAASVLRDMEIQCPIQHHLALPYGLSLVLAIAMALMGHSRLAAGLIISQQRGLRPSEWLRLEKGDVTLPEWLAFGNNGAAVLNLGARTGTKVKRAQAVLIDARRHPLALALIRVLVTTTPPARQLAGPQNLPGYQKVLAAACTSLMLPLFTPHSARAGFATDGFLANRDFVSLREEGRWQSDKSLHTYLDAVTTCSQAASTAAHHWGPTIRWLESNFMLAFVWWPEAQALSFPVLPAPFKPLVLQQSSCRYVPHFLEI